MLGAKFAYGKWWTLIALWSLYSLQTLFDMAAIIKGESIVWQLIFLPIISIPFYILGITKFLKKNCLFKKQKLKAKKV